MCESQWATRLFCFLDNGDGDGFQKFEGNNRKGRNRLSLMCAFFFFSHHLVYFQTYLATHGINCDIAIISISGPNLGSDGRIK